VPTLFAGRKKKTLSAATREWRLERKKKRFVSRRGEKRETSFAKEEGKDQEALCARGEKNERDRTLGEGGKVFQKSSKNGKGRQNHFFRRAREKEGRAHGQGGERFFIDLKKRTRCDRPSTSRKEAVSSSIPGKEIVSQRHGRKCFSRRCTE